MKISACVITKNESENIRRCLESIKSITNEIVVVDTGSTDNTVEIAESLGAKVYFYDWDNNFSNAKNYALDKATGDWIIFLDADEYFAENTPRNLIRILNSINNKSYDAVLYKIIHTEGLNGRIIAENPTIRTFRGHNRIRYYGAVHEQPLNRENTLYAANITDYPLVIYHTGYSSVILPEKVKRNLAIMKEEIAKNNITDLTYYYMSSMNNNLGNSEEAIEYALLALKEPAFHKTIMAYQPYVFIIDNMLKLKEKYTSDEIEKYINEAVSHYPTHPEIWYAVGNARREQGDYIAAIESYRNALEYNKKFKLLLNNNFPARLEYVYYYMAEMYKKTGDSVKALENYFESLKINKHNFDAIKGLYALIKDQEPVEIILFLNSIYDKKDKTDLVFLNTAMADLGNSVLANYYYEQYEKNSHD
ncbi:MAG TPA: glycosyltransferase [Clostridiaceae bacterium]|nr:glycosyltransferase [Clostridiaceae bacterium]